MEQLDDLSLHYGWTVREKQRIDELINRQSRITAIGFAQWVIKENGFRSIGGDDWENDFDIEKIYTTEQLYDKYLDYLQSLNK